MKNLFLVLICVGALALVACERKGPAEKAGEKVDAAAEKVKNTLNPEGPAEKAGKKIDNVVNS